MLTVDLPFLFFHTTAIGGVLQALFVWLCRGPRVRAFTRRPVIFSDTHPNVKRVQGFPPPFLPRWAGWRFVEAVLAGEVFYRMQELDIWRELERRDG